MMSLAGCAASGALWLEPAARNGAAEAAGLTQISQAVSAEAVEPGPTSLIDPRLVPIPAEFNVRAPATWDGRRTLQGIWVAHPEAEMARRVRILNVASGHAVDGALFRRDHAAGDAAVLISSDAAAALGMAVGSEVELSIVAIRRQVAVQAAAVVDGAGTNVPAASASEAARPLKRLGSARATPRSATADAPPPSVAARLSDESGAAPEEERVSKALSLVAAEPDPEVDEVPAEEPRLSAAADRSPTPPERTLLAAAIPVDVPLPAKALREEAAPAPARLDTAAWPVPDWPVPDVEAETAAAPVSDGSAGDAQDPVLRDPPSNSAAEEDRTASATASATAERLILLPAAEAGPRPPSEPGGLAASGEAVAPPEQQVPPAGTLPADAPPPQSDETVTAALAEPGRATDLGGDEEPLAGQVGAGEAGAGEAGAVELNAAEWPEEVSAAGVEAGANPEPAPEPAVAPERPFVQAGIFGVASNADRLVARLAEAGLPAERRPLRAGSNLTRVVAGPFASDAALADALRQVRRLGLTDAHAVKK